MKKKEIVVLDCGVELRQEDQGILFTCSDPGREFNFGIKMDEVGDFMVYMHEYLASKAMKMPEPPTYSASQKEMTPVEKAARQGVRGESLSASLPGTGRVIQASAVSIHK